MNDRQIDQVLVERAQKGDHKAFEMLMSKYQRRLNRLISRFIQDEHEVTAKNFLTTSGRQFFVSSEAANEEGDVLDLTDQIADYHTPEAEMMNREILQTVEASIAQLPDDMRQAITLREMDGLSYEEIARVVDCPIGTVRSRIFRARELIAKDLRPLLDTSEDQRW